MTQSHYEINVAKAVRYAGSDKIHGYTHLFATAERSCVNSSDAKKVLKEIIEKFPEPEYSVTIDYVSISGKGQNIKEFLNRRQVL